MVARIFAHAHRGNLIEENLAVAMALETMVWTRADLARLPDDGNKYEVVRGELFVTPAPGPRHQWLIVGLADLLGRYVVDQGIGAVHQARSVMVYEGSEVEPDIMVLNCEGPPPARWEDAPIPLLVVEVLSRSTRRRDLEQKRNLYLDAGVAEYWIVDGDKRSICVVKHGEADDVVTGTVRWHPPGASAPLEVDVAETFRRALGPAS